MATAATSRPSNTKQRTTLPNRPPRSGLETNRPSLHQTQGDSKVMDFGVPDGWVTWFRDAVQPRTATVALLVQDLDRDALVAEAARFTGAQLVYANLDDATIERVKDAFANHVPATPNSV